MPHPTRREFLGAAALALPAGAAFAAAPPTLDPARISRALAAANRIPAFALGSADSGGDTSGAARNEDLWRDIALAFTVDRSIINLNNGGVSPSPAFVQESMKRHLDHCNTTPSSLALLGSLQPQVETVRTRLARAFGADPEEIAITRNASEGLQICQFGLDLEPGDEVLTTTQDYPRMLTTFDQRARREGVKVVKVKIPVPCEDDDLVIRRFEEAITPRTKIILACHVINLTGQVLPVRKIAAMARRRGIPAIIDGAHALAHLDFQLSDLECDYYATSLHKWLFAPHGSGLLYVRREKIAGLWPLMAAADSHRSDIRKFEEIGTHPLANQLAIAEAITFHETLGPARKLARMIYLRDYWANRLMSSGRAILRTSLKPGFAGGIATVEIEGLDTAALQKWLWEKHRILTVAILHDDVRGLRISPSVYTTLPELDRFCAAIETAMAKGIDS